ncbi:hypothetical protein D3C85_1212430 [compost metagenome]
MQCPQRDLNCVLGILAGRACATGEALEVRLHGNKQLVERTGIALKSRFHQLGIECHDHSARFSLRPTKAHIGQKPMKPVQANTIPATAMIHLIVGSVGMAKAAITATTPMDRRKARSQIGTFF